MLYGVVWHRRVVWYGVMLCGVALRGVVWDDAPTHPGNSTPTEERRRAVSISGAILVEQSENGEQSGREHEVPIFWFLS